jgi:hypothetical protein
MLRASRRAGDEGVDGNAQFDRTHRSSQSTICGVVYFNPGQQREFAVPFVTSSPGGSGMPD